MPAYRTHSRLNTLEVSTDTPLPTLAIVSPTPRAATFPSTAQYAPFASLSLEVLPEHDIKQHMSPSLHTSPHALLRTPSPDSPCSMSSPTFSSPSSSSIFVASPEQPAPGPARTPSPMRRGSSPAGLTIDTSLATPKAPSARRRKSTSAAAAAEPEARRPRKGDEDYIKRPENAFILFRRKCVEERMQQQQQLEAEAAKEGEGAGKPKRSRQADLSKAISTQWKSLSDEDKKYWEQMAKDRKKEHEALYPHYVYRPQRAKKASAKTAGSKGKEPAEPDVVEDPAATFSVHLPLPPSPPGRHGRSSSAPNGGFTSQEIRIPRLDTPFFQSPALELPPPIPNGRRLSFDWSNAQTMSNGCQPPNAASFPAPYPSADYTSSVPWPQMPMQPQQLPPLAMPMQQAFYGMPSATSPASAFSNYSMAGSWASSAATLPPTPSEEGTLAPSPAPELTTELVDELSDMPGLCAIPWSFEFSEPFIPDVMLEYNLNNADEIPLAEFEIQGMEDGTHPFSGTDVVPWADLSGVNICGEQPHQTDGMAGASAGAAVHGAVPQFREDQAQTFFPAFFDANMIASAGRY